MKIAITGGIGSGKSFVCHILETQGVGVYDCDAAAKRLLATDTHLQQRLSDAIGTDVFPNGKMDKAAVARFLMQSEANKRIVNSIVHPAVADDFLASGYEWVESAILFESGFDKLIHPDITVCVAAPTAVRIERIMRRDNLTEEKAQQWINAQMKQDDKIRLSDFVITNDGTTAIEPQLQRLLEHINKVRQE